MNGAQGEMPNAAKSGYSLLDARIPPSTLGRSLRVLGHLLVNKTPEWETEHGGRRLDSAVAAPNPLHKRGRKLEAEHPTQYFSWTNPTGPTGADLVADVLETRSHHTTARRLGEAFFDAALAVPFAARTTATSWGTYETNGGESNVFGSIMRYIIYDTALCYLYGPPAASSTRVGEEDGSSG